MKVFTFIGAPSTGKGSFGKLIATKTAGWAHLSLGEYMRAQITKQTVLGLAIASALSKGHLVSDELANDLLTQSLQQLQDKKINTVILDGYPRTINQAIYFNKTFPELKLSDGFCMPAIVPNPATCKLGPLCNPILEKREDDTRETAEVRYTEFITKTSPLLEYYEERGVLKSFVVKKGMADVHLLTDMMNR